MSSPFGQGTHTVYATSRGGSPHICEIPYSSLSYSLTLDQTSTGRAGIPTGSRVLALVRSWRDELLVYRDDTPAWSGPIIQRRGGSGDGELFCRDHTFWMEKRFIEDDMHIQGDLAEIYKAVWEYGYNKDDSFNVDIIARECGTDGVRDFIGNDFQKVSGVLNELGRTGLDWVMLGGKRVLQVGGEDAFQPDSVPILHDEGVVSVDVDEDGSQFATDYAVFAGALQTGGEPTVGRATRAVEIYGLVQESATELLIADKPSADANALGRLHSMQPTPVQVRAKLSDKAGFGWDVLVPGVRMDVRLSDKVSDPPVEEVMRIRQVDVSVSGSGEESVDVVLVPTGITEDA